MPKAVYLEPGLPLDQIAKYFGYLYGPRNSLALLVYPNMIFNYIEYGAAKVAEGVLKKQREKAIAGVTQVLSGAFALNNQLRGNKTSLAEAMSIKYPAYGCGYCGKMPCACKKPRPPHRSPPPNPKQFEWSLNRWIRHNDEVYGIVNRKQDMSEIILHLLLEVGEVNRAITGGGENLGEPLDARMAKLRGEITDIFARLFAVINIWNQADAEQELIVMFGSGCPECGQSPCNCPIAVSVKGEIRPFGSVSKFCKSV